MSDDTGYAPESVVDSTVGYSFTNAMGYEWTVSVAPYDNSLTVNGREFHIDALMYADVPDWMLKEDSGNDE